MGYHRQSSIRGSQERTPHGGGELIIENRDFGSDGSNEWAFARRDDSK